MGTHVVNHVTINALITFWKENCNYDFYVSPNTCQKAGEKLWLQNLAAVSFWRNEKFDQSVIDSYFFDKTSQQFTPVEIIKLVEFWQYHSGDTDDAKTTEAWKIAETIKNRAIEKLPGYEIAPWGL